MTDHEAVALRDGLGIALIVAVVIVGVVEAPIRSVARLSLSEHIHRVFLEQRLIARGHIVDVAVAGVGVGVVSLMRAMMVRGHVSLQIVNLALEC